jgi:hypothetical protein
MKQDALRQFRRSTEYRSEETVLTSTQKAAWVERQIHQAMLGNLDRIACPYCGCNVVLGVDSFCCEAMTDVAAVLLAGMESTGSNAKDREDPPEAEGSKAASAGNTGDLQ